MQTAGDLVAVLVELTAGVKDCENNLQGAAVLLLMHSGRDASAVILDTDGIVFQDLYIHVRAVAGHSLIYTVVHHLIYQVMQAAFTHVTDVHGGTFAHGLKAFQNLDTACRILLFGLFHLIDICHFLYLFSKSYKYSKFK